MPGFINRLMQKIYGTPTVSHPSHPTHIGPGGTVSQVPLDRWAAGRSGLGTKIADLYGHPDALLAPTEIQRLFSGEWVPVTSSWIAAFQYILLGQESGTLYTRLLNGKEYGPTLVGAAEIVALASAPSKGHTLNKLWKRSRGKP